MRQVSLKEAEFLQKVLPGYYMNIHQNPKTLLPKFFAMFTYQVPIYGTLILQSLFAGFPEKYQTDCYE